jgi:peptidyl-prolyl cis-trans isomerase SurA
MNTIKTFKVIFVLTALYILTQAAFADTKPLDKIVAIVNTTVITESQVDKEVVVTKNQLKSNHVPLPSEQELRDQVINNLIAENIQLLLAKRVNITVSDKEVDDTVEGIAKRNNMSAEMMKTYITKSGVSFADYRNKIKTQMILRRLQQEEFAGKITVTDQEMAQFLNEYKDVHDPNAAYHLQNILIPLSDNPSPKEVQNARDKALKILQSVKNGKDFRQAALANSADKNALHGGDLGYRQLAELPDIFAQQAKNMKPGQVVGPIRAPNGFHLLKLIDIKQTKQQLTNDQVKMFIYERKFNEKVQEWAHKLRNNAYIKIIGATNNSST